MAQSNPEQERRALVASHVQRLTSTPEWDCYAAELEKITTAILESLATTPREEIEYNQGLLQGLRRCKQLPQILIRQGKP